MVASRWFCRSCMGFIPRVYDVNIVIAIATVWCLHLQRSSHKNKQIHISRRTYDDLVKDVRVCVLLCDRIFVYLPFTDRLYPIIMVLLYGIIYSNFPKAKSHFSHIRIIIIVVVVAVTFTPLTIDSFTCRVCFDFFCLLFRIIRRCGTHLPPRKRIFIRSNAILILDLAHDFRHGFLSLFILRCADGRLKCTVYIALTNQLEFHIPALNRNVNISCFSLSWWRWLWWRRCFFPFSFSVFILARGKPNHHRLHHHCRLCLAIHFPCFATATIANAMDWLFSLFFSHFISFSLHALPDTRRPPHSLCERELDGGLWWKTYKFMRCGRQSEIFFVDSILQEHWRWLHKRCATLYDEITMKTKSEKKSTRTTAHTDRPKAYGQCLYTWHPIYGNWRDRDNNTSIPNEDENSSSNSSSQLRPREKEKKARLKRAMCSMAWYEKMFTDIRQRFSWTHSTRCVLCAVK